MILDKDIIYQLFEYIDKNELLSKYVNIFSKNKKFLERIFDVSKDFIYQQKNKLSKYQLLHDKFYLKNWIIEKNDMYKFFFDDLNDTEFLDSFGKKDIFFKSSFHNNFHCDLIKIYNLNLHKYLEVRFKNIKIDIKKTILFNHLKSIKYKKLDIFEHLITNNPTFLSKKKIRLIINLLSKLLSITVKSNLKKEIRAYYYNYSYAIEVLNIIKKYTTNIDLLNKLVDFHLKEKYFINNIINGVNEDGIKEYYQLLLNNYDINNIKNIVIKKKIRNENFYFLYQTYGIETIKKLESKIFKIDNSVFIELIADFKDLKLTIPERLELLNYLIFEKNIKNNLVADNFKLFEKKFTNCDSKYFEKIFENLNFLEFLLKNAKIELKKIPFHFYSYCINYPIFFDFYKNNPNWKKDFEIENLYDYLLFLSIDKYNDHVFRLFIEESNEINFDYTLLFKYNYNYGTNINYLHLELFEKNNIKFDAYLMEFAALKEDLKLINILKNLNCPYDIFVLFAACKKQNYEIFKWSIENGITFDIRCFDLIKNNFSNLINTIHKNNYYTINQIEILKNNNLNNKLIIEYIIKNNLCYNIEIKNQFKNLLNELNKIFFEKIEKK